MWSAIIAGLFQNSLNCSLREFREETLNLISLRKEDVNNSLALVSKEMVFIFHSMNWDKVKLFRKRFKKLIVKNPTSENMGFSLLNSTEMNNLINFECVNDIKMYRKVIKELRKGFQLLDIMISSYQ